MNRTLGPLAVAALSDIAAALPPMAGRDRVLLARRLRARLDGFPEPAPFWGVDAQIRANLTAADTGTELLSRGIWGRPWRDMQPEPPAPTNTLLPAQADAITLSAYAELLRVLRAEAGPLLLGAG